MVKSSPRCNNVQLNKKHVLSNATFSFLITWRSSSSTSAAVYKISSLRYGDISIFKMAAVRHLGIVLPPYKTTHEVSVAGRSCLSNFVSNWYTDLKIQLFEFFAYLAWNAYSGPQNGGFGRRWTPICDYSSLRPPKGTSLHKSASAKLSAVKSVEGSDL